MTSTITSLQLTQSLLQAHQICIVYIYLIYSLYHGPWQAGTIPLKSLTMQKALPCEDCLSTTPSTASSAAASALTTNNNCSTMAKLVAENPVVVFARSGCCMCHVVKLLLHGHGVNPTIFDINEQSEAAFREDFAKIVDKRGAKSDRPSPPFPVVFVGGDLFGGLEEVMAAHISGELVPLLRKAGALWL